MADAEKMVQMNAETAIQQLLIRMADKGAVDAFLDFMDPVSDGKTPWIMTIVNGLYREQEGQLLTVTINRSMKLDIRRCFLVCEFILHATIRACITLGPGEEVVTSNVEF